MLPECITQNLYKKSCEEVEKENEYTAAYDRGFKYALEIVLEICKVK